tara:strand:+ start:431 stop:1474 length:1044 start_codon:yes stop_codon:yes gene_type:complete
MDLYGTGASIGQANALSAEVRNANLGVETVNSDLAEKLDTAKQEESQTSLENQAINMYQGGQALTSFISNPEVQAAVGKLKSRGVKAAGKFLPVSGPERFARGGLEGAESARDIRTAEDVRRAALALGSDADELDPARFAAGAGSETTLDAANLPFSESGATAGVPTEATVGQSIADESAEVTADVSDATGATTEGERALARGGEAAADVGKGIETSADVVRTGAKEALGTFARGAAAGLGGALDIYKDVERGSLGDNWEQKVGNVGNIVGSGLEVLGLATAWTGPLGIGLEALGAGLSLGSTALETYGDVRAAEETDEKTTSDIESERQAAVSSQTIEKAVGRSES